MNLKRVVSTAILAGSMSLVTIAATPPGSLAQTPTQPFVPNPTQSTTPTVTGGVSSTAADLGGLMQATQAMYQQAQQMMSQVSAIANVVNRLPDIFNRLGSLSLRDTQKIFQNAMGPLGFPDMAQVRQQTAQTINHTQNPTRDAIPQPIRIDNQNWIASAEIVRERVLGQQAQSDGKNARDAIANLSLQAQSRNQTVTDAAQGSLNAVQVANNNFTAASGYASKTLGYVNDSNTALAAAGKAPSTQDVLKETAKILAAQTNQDQQAVAIQLQAISNQVAQSGQLANVSDQLQSIHETSATVVAADATQVIQNDESLRLQGATFQVTEELRRYQAGAKQQQILERAAEVGSLNRVLQTGYRSPGTYPDPNP
ncbi:hypothetical protein BST81_16865 [Leptolyngbya sp. 'hensonii']|uniref:hypothetical protein n=1 Tax=Leptolyngbya sp. 'hensonii' TaxID=1922337 RepID=UPI000967159A|nr:hypothetical protein [Leptolyngbya sp. 'hensonii']OLP17461.1 hypothetical protein BST81_16865 [Leptolyngbya sp. 'hensonii']